MFIFFKNNGSDYTESLRRLMQTFQLPMLTLDKFFRKRPSLHGFSTGRVLPFQNEGWMPRCFFIGTDGVVVSYSGSRYSRSTKAPLLSKEGWTGPPGRGGCLLLRFAPFALFAGESFLKTSEARPIKNRQPLAALPPYLRRSCASPLNTKNPPRLRRLPRIPHRRTPIYGPRF